MTELSIDTLQQGGFTPDKLDFIATLLDCLDQLAIDAKPDLYEPATAQLVLALQKSALGVRSGDPSIQDVVLEWAAYLTSGESGPLMQQIAAGNL